MNKLQIYERLVSIYYDLADDCEEFYEAIKELVDDLGKEVTEEI